jgi:hypothetical protein
MGCFRKRTFSRRFRWPGKARPPNHPLGENAARLETEGDYTGPGGYSRIVKTVGNAQFSLSFRHVVLSRSGKGRRERIPGFFDRHVANTIRKLPAETSERSVQAHQFQPRSISTLSNCEQILRARCEK